MQVSERVLERLRDNAAKRELNRVVEVANQCFVPHAPRFTEREYLRAVYSLYHEWLEKGRAEGRAVRLAKLYERPVRGDTHPIRVIIDCATPQPAEKARSKWSLALRFAVHKKVSPSDLIQFFEDDKNGGMAGCAKKFAKLSDAQKSAGLLRAKARPKKAVVKKSAAPSPVENADGEDEEPPVW
jgi:hypothetical protein